MAASGVTIDQLSPVEQYVLRHVRPESDLDIGAAPDQLIRWLQESAIPLKTADPGADHDDLLPLRPIIGDARVVGLGEATHGTSEFFTLKQRIFRFLVEEIGFTVLGVESGFAESLGIGAYVRGGPPPSFAGQHPELVALVEWMRDQNSSGRRPQLRFFGFDMQSATLAVSRALAIARPLDPSVERIERDLAPLGSEFGTSHYRAAAPSARQRVQGGLAVLQERLQTLATAGSGDDDLDLAALLVQSAVWAERYAYFPTQRERDEAMAAMVLSILEREGPNAKIALWAHNAHIQRGGLVELVGGAKVPTMGALLHERLGSDYLPVTFAFDRGSFRARNLLGAEDRVFTVPAAPAHVLDGALARAGHPLAIFPLRDAPRNGAAADWLAARPSARCIGGASTERLADLSLVRADPRVAADIVVFVAETTAARASIEGDVSEDSTPEPMLPPSAANLDFRDVDEGGSPRGWELRGGTGEGSISVVEGCLMLRRRGEDDGSTSVVHHVALEDDEERMVRVRAELASEPGPWPGGAHLTLRYASQADIAGQLSNPPFVLAPTFPIDDDEWHAVHLALGLPATVRAVELGLTVVGNGNARLRGLSVDSAKMTDQDPPLLARRSARPLPRGTAKAPST